MDVVRSVFYTALNDIKTMSVGDVFDIIIVAYLIYKVIGFVRKTNSYNLARGVVLILIALWVSDVFQLTMINFLLRRTVELGLIALLILFQPELRRLLERMGRGFSARRSVSSPVMETAITQTVLACTDMSASRTGALLIFERREKLNQIMSTGTIINSDVSAELIKNIFFNKAPLHDGAVIIREGRIEAAGCVLPLTQKVNLSKDLGMRHRAGIGLSEQSDAVVVIVSEETGSISVAVEGMLKRHLYSNSLEQILHNELIEEEQDTSVASRILRAVRNFYKGNMHEKNEKNNRQ